MTRYSVHPRERIFMKDYGFCLLLKIWIKITVIIRVKPLVVNKVRKFLIMLKNVQQMHLKLVQKE